MSDAFAYAMLRIHQHLARDARAQRTLEELFLAFLAGGLTPEQYEHRLGVERGASWRK